MQDALTKLSNRVAFDDFFAKAMVRFHHKPFELALIVIDIDDFKNINDTYGHTAGDKTLQVIANSIVKNVSKGVFVGRYGGEEFVLIYSKTQKETLIAELNTLNRFVARLPFKFKVIKSVLLYQLAQRILHQMITFILLSSVLTKQCIKLRNKVKIKSFTLSNYAI